MYNDYYLLKRVQEEQGAVSFASVQDSFTYKGEVIACPPSELKYKLISECCNADIKHATGVSDITGNYTYESFCLSCCGKNPKVLQGNYNPKIGDTVLFLKGSGEDVTINGEQMKAVKLEDIIMKID